MFTKSTSPWGKNMLATVSRVNGGYTKSLVWFLGKISKIYCSSQSEASNVKLFKNFDILNSLKISKCPVYQPPSDEKKY